MALLWATLFIPVQLYLSASAIFINELHPTDYVLLFSPIVFLVGAVAGFKRPWSSWGVLLPLTVVLPFLLFVAVRYQY